jgi:O-antigen/teichoic acid export membrane protein
MLLVSSMASTRALADYVVATRLLDATVTLAHTLGIGLFPGIAALAVDAPDAARRHVRRYLVAVLGLSVPLAVLGTVLAEPVTTAIFGDEWRSAVPAVRVLAIVTPVILVAYLLWFVLLAEQQERWLFGGAVAGAAVGVGATAVLLAVAPGAAAGAWGTAAGAVVLAVVLSSRFIQTRRAGRHRRGRSPAEPQPNGS